MTECVADKPVLVMTWTGQDPSLPAIMLNSHTDVVPGLTYQNERERQEEPNRAIEGDKKGPEIARKRSKARKEPERESQREPERAIQTAIEGQREPE